MKGKELKYLAGVADLARLDLEAAAVTILAQGGDEVIASYAGNYSGGWRKIKTDVKAFEIPVPAARFKQMAGLFADDDEVDLRYSNAVLTLKSKQSSIQLRKWSEPSPPEEVDNKQVDMAARTTVSKLLAEAEVAAEFVAPSMLRPILTGLWLGCDEAGGRMTVRAFNGFGALFESSIDTKIKGSGNVTVPTQDFLLGVRLIGDGDLVMVQPKGKQSVIVYNDRAMFRCSLVAGEWPDVQSVMSQNQPNQVKVAGQQIANLVNSAKFLDAGLDVDVGARNGQVVFGVRGDYGSYVTSFKGKLPRDLRYDAQTLGLAAKMGDDLTFHMPDRSEIPTMVVNGERRCWLVTRV